MVLDEGETGGEQVALIVALLEPGLARNSGRPRDHLGDRSRGQPPAGDGRSGHRQQEDVLGEQRANHAPDPYRLSICRCTKAVGDRMAGCAIADFGFEKPHGSWYSRRPCCTVADCRMVDAIWNDRTQHYEARVMREKFSNSLGRPICVAGGRGRAAGSEKRLDETMVQPGMATKPTYGLRSGKPRSMRCRTPPDMRYCAGRCSTANSTVSTVSCHSLPLQRTFKPMNAVV